MHETLKFVPSSDTQCGVNMTNSEPEQGLSTQEAAARLGRDGPNTLPAPNRNGIWDTAKEVIREPMFAMLIIGAALYLALGETDDGMLLLAAVVMVISLTLYHEHRTDRALEALAKFLTPRARVLREGREQKIPSHEVVVGDLVIVAEGERVPADAILRRSSHLAIDESLLTGESLPVTKNPRSKSFVSRAAALTKSTHFTQARWSRPATAWAKWFVQAFIPNSPASDARSPASAPGEHACKMRPNASFVGSPWLPSWHPLWSPSVTL